MKDVEGFRRPHPFYPCEFAHQKVAERSIGCKGGANEKIDAPRRHCNEIDFVEPSQLRLDRLQVPNISAYANVDLNRKPHLRRIDDAQDVDDPVGQ